MYVSLWTCQVAVMFVIHYINTAEWLVYWYGFKHLNRFYVPYTDFLWNKYSNIQNFIWIIKYSFDWAPWFLLVPVYVHGQTIEFTLYRIIRYLNPSSYMLTFCVRMLCMYVYSCVWIIYVLSTSVHVTVCGLEFLCIKMKTLLDLWYFLNHFELLICCLCEPLSDSLLQQ